MNSWLQPLQMGRAMAALRARTMAAQRATTTTTSRLNDHLAAVQGPATMDLQAIWLKNYCLLTMMNASAAFRLRQGPCSPQLSAMVTIAGPFICLRSAISRSESRSKSVGSLRPQTSNKHHVLRPRDGRTWPRRPVQQDDAIILRSVFTWPSTQTELPWP